MYSRGWVLFKRAPPQGETVRMNVINNQAEASAAGASKVPAHEIVYRTLRDRILFGDLAPGEPVTIQGLVQVLGAGMTPVREAIRRLISDGALRFQDNRRVSVPVLTRAHLDEILFLRTTVETRLAWLAAQRMTPQALGQLTEIDEALDRAIAAGDVQGYLRQNYLFHACLYAQSKAPILAGLADDLWLRFGPSLRVVCGRFGTQGLPDRHKEILAALAAGDADAVAEAMRQDVEQGMDQIAEALSDPPRGARGD